MARSVWICAYSGAKARAVGGYAKRRGSVFRTSGESEKAMRGRPGKLDLALDSLDAEVVRLRVTDNGRGIAKEHLEQVFEPFFTTKEDWQGQGLGLAVAYRIIEAHSGSIKLDSKLGEGTTVTIRLVGHSAS